MKLYETCSKKVTQNCISPSTAIWAEQRRQRTINIKSRSTKDGTGNRCHVCDNIKGPGGPMSISKTEKWVNNWLWRNFKIRLISLFGQLTSNNGELSYEWRFMRSPLHCVKSCCIITLIHFCLWWCYQKTQWGASQSWRSQAASPARISPMRDLQKIINQDWQRKWREPGDRRSLIQTCENMQIKQLLTWQHWSNWYNWYCDFYLVTWSDLEIGVREWWEKVTGAPATMVWLSPFSHVIQGVKWTATRKLIHMFNYYVKNQ